MRSLNRPSCGIALLGDVELRHDLDAGDDRAVEPLVDRAHRRLEDAVDPVFHVDRVVLGLDVDVAGAPLNRRVDRRIDETDDRAGIGGQFLDRELVLAGIVLPQNLQLEALGGLLEDTGRALALLQDRLDRGRGPDHHPDRRREHHRQLVDHRQIGRIRNDDHQRLSFATIRYEPIPQHQLGRDGAEEVVVDAEVGQIEERQSIPVRQPPRLRDFGGLLSAAGLLRRHAVGGRAPAGEATEIGCGNLYVHRVTSDEPHRSADDRLKSGR